MLNLKARGHSKKELREQSSTRVVILNPVTFPFPLPSQHFSSVSGMSDFDSSLGVSCVDNVMSFCSCFHFLNLCLLLLQLQIGLNGKVKS